MLLFDHGERRSGVPAELERLGVAVQAVRLPAGDYVVSDRLVVERKGPTDLAASIKDRRLFEQLGRLADAYPSVVLMVEGEPVHMHEAAWQGALGRALTLGASVLRTRDARDSAEWLARLYRLEGKPAASPRGVPRLRRPTADDLQTAEDVLRCLPGISTVGAGRLLAHFGSLERVFAARHDELLEVRGIGPVRARTLDRLFRTTAAGRHVRSLAA
jgi:ERCC4-type nuclease